MNPTPTASNFLEAIPAPDEIRDRLSQLAQERNILRTMLRLAERKAKAQAGRQKKEEPTLVA
jgi:hypothetical protein